MRKLLFIIVLFFSTSVLSAEYYAPCLKSSDITRVYGPPKFHSGYNFFWFTVHFTAICEVEAGDKEYCYMNRSLEELEFLKGKTIYKFLIARPENSCQ